MRWLLFSTLLAACAGPVFQSDGLTTLEPPSGTGGYSGDGSAVAGLTAAGVGGSSGTVSTGTGRGGSDGGAGGMVLSVSGQAGGNIGGQAGSDSTVSCDGILHWSPNCGDAQVTYVVYNGQLWYATYTPNGCRSDCPPEGNRTLPECDYYHVYELIGPC